jgi:monoterpene epsilon-lactone hydrolase
MPSQAMQDLIDEIREQRRLRSGQAPLTLQQLRADFAPAGRVHVVPKDVTATEVTAGGVVSHWLTAPGADSNRVLFPEYRLAPEHPFPAAVEDVLATWNWIRKAQKVSASSVAVAGASAGGGLAVALLVAARDAGEALPAAAVLMSPTVDLTGSGVSMTERADQDPFSTPEMLRQFARDYLAGADPRTALASPLFASLAGLPPLLVQVGTADVLLSDSERLAAAASDAGVDVTLKVGEGLPHVYPIMAGTPEAAQATDEVGTFLGSRVG